ncbi:MAG: ribonuclease HI family protein [Gemmataceae bacterium]|nr:ribonuclease HI family protein [Gemmataceae bacterium]
MSDESVFTIHTDGAARGNPGPAAFAYVIHREGAPDLEVKGCLGETTNNVAEYTAVVRALEHAHKLGARRVVVLSDSELMVNQMTGKYQVKNEGLRPLYQQARAASDQFESATFRHVRRAQNGRADALCNQALDAAQGGKHGGGARKAHPAKSAKGKTSPEHADAVREEAVECLRAVATAWARGNPRDPKPEDVWEQLWTILQDGGVLRPARSR